MASSVSMDEISASPSDATLSTGIACSPELLLPPNVAVLAGADSSDVAIARMPAQTLSLAQRIWLITCVRYLLPLMYLGVARYREVPIALNSKQGSGLITKDRDRHASEVTKGPPVE